MPDGEMRTPAAAREGWAKLLPAETLRRVVDAIHDLGTFRFGGETGLADAAEIVAHVTGTEKLCAYRLDAAGDHLSVGDLQGVNVDADLIRRTFGEYLASAPVEWGHYNPIRPQAWQRNRVCSLAVLNGRVTQTPALLAFYRRWGFGGRDQIRVLVCEGASLLGYVGLWQDELFTRTQRLALAALVPALRRRLRTERDLGDLPRTRAGLDAALDAIGRAAFVTDAHGRIRETNALARALLARDGDTGARITRATRVGVAARVTAIRLSGDGTGYLVIEAPRARDVSTREHVAAAVARFGLTKRQAQVLAEVCAGASNRAIAARQGIAERTVEFHVTALLARAEVAGRAELVAAVLKRGP